MSDHVDGPRSIGDPSADLTDLFAFTSPENPGAHGAGGERLSLGGRSAVFSNAINHSIVVRRASVAGLGDAAKFQTGDPEIRFSVRFDPLEPRPTERQADAARHLHACPTARPCASWSTTSKGATTPDGAFRVFAGLRSDPFYLAWLVAS